MKLNNKILSRFFLVFTLLFMACDNEDPLVITEADPAFELLRPTISNINLNFNTPDNAAFTITWVDDITGGSSGYIIEADTDAEFSSPINLGSSAGSTFTMTVDEFNDVLLDIGANAFEPFTIFMRLDSGGIKSNSISFSVSSFPETPPVITSPAAGTQYVASDVAPDDILFSATWEDPDFGDESSVTVIYEIQFGRTGTNFETSETFAVEGDDPTSFELSHEAFNDLALDLGLTAEEEGSLDVRIKATIVMSDGNMERYSDTIDILVTPYDVALPPILYGVGAGLSDAGWSWDTPVELALQGTVYSGNVNLTPENDGNFRFFTINNDWDSGQNYLWYEDRQYTIDSNLVNAMDNDNNFQFIGDAGEYFLQIDTEARTITLGPPVVGPNCSFDQLWLVGAGIVDAGWSWDTPVSLPCTGNGTYAGNVALTNDAFRFFTINNNWDSGTNYPTYVSNGYTIDAVFEDAMDGDNNFFFNGTPGTYYITVDDINKTITVGPEQLECEFEQLWLVGAGIVDAGWYWDMPVALPCTGPGVYSGSVALTNDAFRFFTINNDWDSGTNYPTYVSNGYTIDAEFEDAMDGDNNFLFNGTPGTYTLTVDTVNLTITLD